MPLLIYTYITLYILSTKKVRMSAKCFKKKNNNSDEPDFSIDFRVILKKQPVVPTTKSILYAIGHIANRLRIDSI